MNKLSYALGLSMGQHMMEAGIEKIDSYDDFIKGISAILNGEELAITEEEVDKILTDYSNEVKVRLEEEHKKMLEKNLDNAKQFLKENESKEGVKKTDTGLQYKVIAEGGIMQWPNAHSRVRVHYEGRFPDGTVFDSSYERGKPVEFGLDQVIPGWAEGVCLMKPGSKYELYLPPHLAYGEHGVPGHIPGNSALVFTVELLDILDTVL